LSAYPRNIRPAVTSISIAIIVEEDDDDDEDDVDDLLPASCASSLARVIEVPVDRK
jgi:hypothetical protein